MGHAAFSQGLGMFPIFCYLSFHLMTLVLYRFRALVGDLTFITRFYFPYAFFNY